MILTVLTLQNLCRDQSPLSFTISTLNQPRTSSFWYVKTFHIKLNNKKVQQACADTNTCFENLTRRKLWRNDCINRGTVLSMVRISGDCAGDTACTLCAITELVAGFLSPSGTATKCPGLNWLVIGMCREDGSVFACLFVNWLDERGEGWAQDAPDLQFGQPWLRPVNPKASQCAPERKPVPPTGPGRNYRLH
jgi:hypothetical protein